MDQKPATEPKTYEILSSKDAEATYSKLFAVVSELEANDIIFKSNCKICNHPIRSELEATWEKNNRANLTRVENRLREYEEQNPEVERVCYDSIRNHLRKHYAQQEKQINIKEYTRRLSELMNHKIADDKKFDLLSISLEDKFIQIASDPDMCPLKQAEIMTKISKSILDIIVIQSKLRGELDAVRIITDKFQRIWTHMISKQTNPIAKQELMIALDKFQDLAEGITLAERPEVTE